MKRHCQNHECGLSIDRENLRFGPQEANLVYMDKVFSLKESSTCPLLFNLNTAAGNPHDFTVEFTMQNANGCCNPCTLTRDAVFDIDKFYVVLEEIGIRPPTALNRNQVTIDCFPVDSLEYSSGQYTAGTAHIISQIQEDECLNAGLPTKAFFLVSNAGPWEFRAKYVLEGSVNTCNQTCCFKAEIRNANNAPSTRLPNGATSNFAIPDLSLPCAVNGVAPDVQFQFDGKIKMINPQLHVVNGAWPRNTQVESEEECGCNAPRRRPCNGPLVVDSAGCSPFRVALCASLVIEPTIHVETVRRTLFSVDAAESLARCEGADPGNDCGCDRWETNCDVDWDREKECNCNWDHDCDCGCHCEDQLADICGSGCNCNNNADQHQCGCHCGCGGNRPSHDHCHRPSHDHCHRPGIQPRTAFQFNGCNGCSW